MVLITVLIIAYHIIITVLIHTTSIALHKWSRIRISFEDVQQAFEARAATTPAGVQVLSSSNTGAGARTCTAAGLYNSSPSDCSPFSSSVNGSGCPSRRRCVKAASEDRQRSEDSCLCVLFYCSTQPERSHWVVII